MPKPVYQHLAQPPWIWPCCMLDYFEICNFFVSKIFFLNKLVLLHEAIIFSQLASQIWVKKILHTILDMCKLLCDLQCDYFANYKCYRRQFLFKWNAIALKVARKNYLACACQHLNMWHTVCRHLQLECRHYGSLDCAWALQV